MAHVPARSRIDPSGPTGRLCLTRSPRRLRSASSRSHRSLGSPSQWRGPLVEVRFAGRSRECRRLQSGNRQASSSERACGRKRRRRVSEEPQQVELFFIVPDVGGDRPSRPHGALHLSQPGLKIGDDIEDEPGDCDVHSRTLRLCPACRALAKLTAPALRRPIRAMQVFRVWSH